MGFLIIFGMACLAVTVAYGTKCLKDYGYIVSPYNALPLIFIFCLLISPAFLISDESWHALFIGDAAGMEKFTIESMAINLGGFILFILFSGYLVFSKRSNVMSRAVGVLERKCPEISDRAIIPSFVLFIALFVFLCMAYNEGAFPLLNAQRDFSSSYPVVSQLYTISRSSIALFGLYFGIRMADKVRPYLPLFLVALTASLLTGNRSSAIIYIAFPAIMNCILKRYGTKEGKPLAKAQLLIAGICLLIGVAGVQFSFVRDGVSLTTLQDAFSSLINGNTFSDVRDGALLLRGFEGQFGGEPIGGMTYLASLFSFLPSSLLGIGLIHQLKQMWLWGPFSVRLAMWPDANHFGFRGGWFMEGYINFGLFGIVIIAALIALTYSLIDTMYRKGLAQSGGRPGTILLAGLLLTLMNCLICTSSMYELFIQICLIALLYLATKLINRVAKTGGIDVG